jgi:hypothetical protein
VDGEDKSADLNSGSGKEPALEPATLVQAKLVFWGQVSPSRNCLAVVKRAPINSPRRHMRTHARRTDPLEFKHRTKISGTTSAPTSMQTPDSEMSLMKHATQGHPAPESQIRANTMVGHRFRIKTYYFVASEWHVPTNQSFKASRVHLPDPICHRLAVSRCGKRHNHLPMTART